MPRLSLALVIPPLLLALTAVLFLHRWMAEPDQGPPPPTTAAAREAAGITTAGGPARPGAANSQRGPTEMNPVPAGTPDVGTSGNAPPAATPTAPSSEPARAPAGG